MIPSRSSCHGLHSFQQWRYHATVGGASPLSPLFSFLGPPLLDGYAIYFTVNFDDDIFFSTHPMGLNTSWAGRLLSVEQRNLGKSQSFEFNMNIEDISDPNSCRWSIN